MRNTVSFILVFLVSFSSLAIDSLFEEGLDNIMKKDFKKAQMGFLKDAEKQPSFSAFYNLGVASGSLGEWSKAKWAFESSLKYKPLSGDAQFNAKFASQKLSQNNLWEHPYPWHERLILGFGATTWSVLAIVTSSFLGLLIFNILTKKKSKLRKWCLRLIAPAILLFLVSFYGVNSINKHYNEERYGIMKAVDVPFYISPNGVQIQNEVDPGSRLEIKKYFKDSTWVQIKAQNSNLLWIENKNLYTY